MVLDRGRMVEQGTHEDFGGRTAAADFDHVRFVSVGGMGRKEAGLWGCKKESISWML